MTDQTKRGWVVPILTSLITSLAVLAGAWFTFKGNVDSAHYANQSSQLQSAFQRIEHLENQMQEQQAVSSAKIIELTGQVYRLQSQLDKDLNILDLFSTFMNGLPFEAWLKEVELDENGDYRFRMLLINAKYAYTYNVSSSRYQGATDRDIWGEELGSRFSETDRKVMRTKASVVTTENFPTKISDIGNPDTYKEKLVVKVYLELIEGKPMVFGMAMDLNEYK